MANIAQILVVDDDKDIRDSIRIILEKAGHQVRQAVNGRDALAKLKEKVPDLMILDIMMSTDTEGFDLAYELKNSEDFGDLPIILLTSFLEKVREDGPDQFQHVMGEAWPAKWFFEKPVDSKKLVAKVAEVLASRNQ